MVTASCHTPLDPSARPAVFPHRTLQGQTRGPHGTVSGHLAQLLGAMALTLSYGLDLAMEQRTNQTDPLAQCFQLVEA
ncbi:hypothetical protein RRG08_028695 [Elysia crispata]|uniref:Uncharacterized protein n=1 Tax=Elysia crispata TaxID=231223 RepID=A0AAE0XNA3_9GAST|nr:hypothetical protein RRG08_028695 [Elysia crispata]